MENEERFLDTDPPTVEIRRLLKLRGINHKKFIEDTGLSYHFFSKFMSQATYKTYDGKKHKFKAIHIRKALAEFLNIPFDDLWGEKGKEILNNLIEQEIEKKCFLLKEDCHANLSDIKAYKWNWKLFIKNLIALGKYRVYWGAREK